MKIAIADMAADCFPADVSFEGFDPEAAARITARVMAQIKPQPRCRRYVVRKVIGTLLIAAVLVSLLTVTAYALGLFGLNWRMPEPEETINGTWAEENAAGEKFDVGMYYPDAGMVITYDCDSAPHKIRFKPHWVPAEIMVLDPGNVDEEGWYRKCGHWDADDILYDIGIRYAAPGYQLVVNGDVDLVKEEQWENLAVKELTAAWDPVGMAGALANVNYVILFSKEDGYLLTVSGTADLETLEHIAKELEIDVTDELHKYNPDFNIGILNLGRG